MRNFYFSIYSSTNFETSSYNDFNSWYSIYACNSSSAILIDTQDRLDRSAAPQSFNESQEGLKQSKNEFYELDGYITHFNFKIECRGN